MLVQEYGTKLKSFSRNAKLYLVHIVGMDVIYGTMEVLFNLYLLLIGFDAAFVGLRLLIQGVSRTLFALPTGALSDRLGRKAGFIIGDGGGAAMSMINITTLNPTVLLVTPVFQGFFGTLHHNSEEPFMAENSEPKERIHLFSFASGVRTLAAMAGALLVGVALIPTAHHSVGITLPTGLLFDEKLFLYRAAFGVGIIGWFLSLIPALALKEYRGKTSNPATAGAAGRPGFTLKNVSSWHIVKKIVTVEAISAAGFGMTIPLMNIYFKQGLKATESDIALIFGLGALLISAGSFLAPSFAKRFGVVKGVSMARSLAIPFVLVLGFSSQIAGGAGLVLLVAGASYMFRGMLTSLPNPVNSVFIMGLLQPRERATVVGIQSLAVGAIVGVASYVSGIMMSTDTFYPQFVALAALSAVSSALYYIFFKKYDSSN